MSQELDYFPPQGTKWKWGSKALNYSPWMCNLADQREPKLWLHSVSIILYVDKIMGKYVWRIRMHNFSGKCHEMNGKHKTALGACLAAEKRGEKELDKLLPDWVRIALTNKWRPPA